MSEPRALDPIDVRDLGDGRWRLLADVRVDLGRPVQELEAHDGRFAWPTLAGTTVALVPAGTETDFASVPVLAQLLLGPKDGYRLAGLLHDRLYQQGVRRALADRVFRWVAQAGRVFVPVTRSWLGWAGLRLGGWVAWRRYARGAAAG